MDANEHWQLVKKVKRSLNKRKVKFSDVARDLTELGYDITENYLAQLASGRIKTPRESRLVVLEAYFNSET